MSLIDKDEFEEFLTVSQLVSDLEPRFKEDLFKLERRFSLRVEEVGYPALLPRRAEPLRVLHSADDGDVPIEGGEQVSARWRGAEFVAFDGLGHRRILRAPEVIASAVEFLTVGVRKGASTECTG